MIACSIGSRLIGGTRCRGRRLEMDILSAKQINGRLIEFGAQLVALIGARDVTHGDFDAADDRLDIDGRRRRK